MNLYNKRNYITRNWKIAIKKVLGILSVFLLFSFGGNSQNTSYNLNSVPISGTENSSFGYESLLNNNSGSFNTAVGFQTLRFSRRPQNNTAIGYRALSFLFGSAESNTAVGSGSMQSFFTGNYNTAVGQNSLNTLSNSFTFGNYITVLGYNSTVNSAGLINATAIGSNSIVNESNSIQLGDVNVTTVLAGVGTNATLITGGLQVSGGTPSVGKVLTSDAIGNATWQTPNGGGGGGGSGWGLTGNTGTTDGTNFIGTTDNVPLSFTVNNQKAGRLDNILGNTFYGVLAGTGNVTGNSNTAIGNKVSFGSSALINATAIGSNAIVNTSNTVQLGDANVRLVYAGTGTNASLITGGLQVTGGTLGAGKVLTSDAAGNATWQVPSGGGGGGNSWNLTGNLGTDGTLNGTNFIGTTDDIPLNFRVNNQTIGRLEATNRNVFWGTGQFFFNPTGQNNNAMGDFALGNNLSGSSNVAIGSGALSVTSTGGNNTGIGTNASSTLGNIIESSAIGVGSLVNTSSKMRLGSTSMQRVETQVQYSVVSDGRFKYNISEKDVVGLAFIQKLRPVVYNFNARSFTQFLTQSMPESIKSKYLDQNFEAVSAIRQTGFIAQEVETAASAVGYNFNGLHKPDSKEDNYSLSYAQFVVPLVKAVQELSVQNQNLLQKSNEQSKQNEDLQKDIAELRSMVESLKKNNIEGSIKINEDHNEAKLYQNTPNPFNKTTTIRYNLPANSKGASIIVTNMSGIKIKSFNLNPQNGELLNINGGELSAGTYIYSLIIDDVLVDSKKMILTK